MMMGSAAVDGLVTYTNNSLDVFRKTADVGPVAASANAIGAKCLWQQLGVLNHEADALVRATDSFRHA